MTVEDAKKHTSLFTESLWSKKKKSPEGYYLFN